MRIPPAAYEAFGGLRVLVVDDQEHVRKWARRVLASLSVKHVFEADGGHSALAMVTTPGTRFDLILCDLKMPMVDGIELVRALSAMRVDTAVALLSVEPERVLETSARLAARQGLRVLGTIAKPLTGEKLVPLLHATVARASAASSGATEHAPGEIRDALTSGALHLLYQPRIAIATGRLVGVEALARWKHPEFGPVGPDVFVAMCEESPPLGEWLLAFALREALAFGQRARESGLDLDVAINVHAGAFDSITLPEQVEAIADEAGMPPGRVTLEVTERSVAHDAVHMLDVATRLRLKGFNLAIDDFGTGHSGLAQLCSLPFNLLKIDRQFVHGSAESSTKRSVVEASVALARNLSMTSVAEGVQQRPEWDLLQRIGCEEMQGFFIGRPMTEEGFSAWAAQWNLNAAATGIVR